MSPISTVDLAQLTDAVFSATIDAAATPVTAAGEIGGRTVIAVVHISGGWEGTVAIQVPMSLASRIARAMFRLGDEGPSDADIHDAVGEVANMVGGGFKARLGLDCCLSLPTVVDGNDCVYCVPGAHLEDQLWLISAGDRFSVSILARDAGAEIRGHVAPHEVHA